jgi:hypothetical protein
MIANVNNTRPSGTKIRTQLRSLSDGARFAGVRSQSKNASSSRRHAFLRTTVPLGFPTGGYFFLPPPLSPPPPPLLAGGADGCGASGTSDIGLLGVLPPAYAK